MGRAPCCSKVGLHRGPWSAREDTLLLNYIQAHGEGHWRSLPKKAGLLRCGKSCRLRWMNYLRPDIKRGNISPDEDDLIIRLHSLLGNRWSLIAKRLPGRTDNEIKNYWNSHLSKRQKPAEQTNPKSSISPPSPFPPTTTRSRPKAAIKRSSGRAGTGKKDDQHHHHDKPAAAKVHQPKASRVSPFSVITRSASLDSMISGSSSSSGSGLVDLNANNNNKLDTEMFNFPPHNWCDDVNAAAASASPTYSGKPALIICEELADEEFPYGFDAATFLDAGGGALPVGSDNNGNMLDHIFEEYQQLLEADHHVPGETDSFLDSLLL